MHSRQAVVPGAGAVVAHFFQVLQERRDERGIGICHVELGRGLVGALLGEAEQEPEGVPVAGDGVRAGAFLAGQPVGEERFERRGQGAHRRAPRWPSMWAMASSVSSGTAEKYQ